MDAKVGEHMPPIIQQLIAFMESYRDGQISHGEFSAIFFILRDMIEETDAVIDGTTSLKMLQGHAGDELAREYIGQLAAKYKQINLTAVR